jgi:hypothetical protein
MLNLMYRHLVIYIALLLAALIPLETAYTMNGCASVVATDNHIGDCGDCVDGERQQCLAYCIALCQSFATSYIQEVRERSNVSSEHYPHGAAFSRISPEGPEPPPPRMP